MLQSTCCQQPYLITCFCRFVAVDDFTPHARLFSATGQHHRAAYLLKMNLLVVKQGDFESAVAVADAHFAEWEATGACMF